MPLISNSYGKGRVRVMRVDRGSDRHEVRELTVQAMLEGGFAAAYTAGDNAAVVATDTPGRHGSASGRSGDAC